MATIIVMPRLSPTMEEGVLVKWTKKPGDKISPGDVIAEVETDKANMDFPFEDEATLLKLLVAEGTTVKLGAPVAIVGEPGEDPEGATLEGQPAAPPAKAAPATETPPATPAAPAPATETKVAAPASPTETKVAAPAATTAPATETKPPVPAVTTAPATETKVSAPTPPTASAPETKAAPAQAEPKIAPPDPSPVAATPTRHRSSPLARRIARERSIDLATVAGSGPHGRVIVRDLEKVRPPAPATATVARAPSVAPSPPLAEGADQTVPFSLMRKTIARRLVEAKSTIPHFYLTMDADGEALFDFHRQLKAAEGEHGIKVSLNDLVIKALATALVRIPEANSSWGAEGIVRYGRVDIGVAVSIDEGLITPVVRSADRKSIGTIARETRDLVERARLRKLRPEEFSGSTFSLSNMGMYGVREFAAIINPPEAGILAVGALQKRAVVVEVDGEDTLEIRRQMTLTLSCDHRVVDGALGARLLSEVVSVIESPVVLAL